MIERGGKVIAKSKLNIKVYSKLLGKIAPTVITSDKEYERLMAEFDKLFHKETLTPEESALFEILITLIQKYEKEHMVSIKKDPLGMLKFFMEQHDKKPKDLWEVFGSKGIASEILHGKRQINVNQAKKLGKFFHAAPELFIDLDDE